MGLGVRAPTTSLFHDEKFAFFDLGVRGTSNILKIFLRVSLKILKKVEFLPAAAKVLPAAARGRGASFQNFWSTPNPKVKKCEFLVVKEACRRSTNP